MDINKLTIDVDKAITFTCFKLIELFAYEVDMKKIPVKGTNNKSVSNIIKFKLINKCPSLFKLIGHRVSCLFCHNIYIYIFACYTHFFFFIVWLL